MFTTFIIREGPKRRAHVFAVLYKLQSRLIIIRKIIIRKNIKIFFLIKRDTDSLTCCNSTAKQTGTSVLAGLAGNGFKDTRCQDYVPLKDSLFKPSSSMLANNQKDQTER